MSELKRKRTKKVVTQDEIDNAIELNNKHGTVIASKLLGTDSRTFVKRYSAYGIEYKDRPEINLSVPAISISENFLYNLRKKHYLTQHQMAVILDVSQPQYGRYELAPESILFYSYLRLIAYFGEDTVLKFLKLQID